MVREAQGQEPTPLEAPFGACVHAPDALVQVPLVQAQVERGQIRLATPLLKSAERTWWEAPLGSPHALERAYEE